MPTRHYLTTHRKKWGLSQKELGELLGLSRATISNYEQHLNLPSLPMALRLEIIFGETAGYLFPTLYEQNEEEVMLAAARIRQRIEGRSDKSSRRKLRLFDEMMERAVSKPTL